MRIIFAGTPQNSAAALEQVAQHHEVVLVITRPDAEVGRKRVLTPSPVAQMAERLGIETLKISRIRQSDLDRIMEANADLALVVAYGSLIPQSALEALRWWNIHFSLLPQWRGASPLQQSIRSGGVGAGVTLFELDAGMDTGAVVAQLPISLGINESTGDALLRFTKAGVDLFNQVANSGANPTPQRGAPTYAPKLDRHAAKLDFSKTATELHREVLAFNPEPMAWCEFRGNPLRIIDTRLTLESKMSNLETQPGRVTKQGESIYLHCGYATQIELVTVQPAGKQSMRAADWFRGIEGEIHLA